MTKPKTIGIIKVTYTRPDGALRVALFSDAVAANLAASSWSHKHEGHDCKPLIEAFEIEATPQDIALFMNQHMNQPYEAPRPPIKFEPGYNNREFVTTLNKHLEQPIPLPEPSKEAFRKFLENMQIEKTSLSTHLVLKQAFEQLQTAVDHSVLEATADAITIGRNGVTSFISFKGEKPTQQQIERHPFISLRRRRSDPTKPE
jgi:hypothetical protein